MLDCAIIGSGVAAVSAALTLKNNHKDFIMLGFSSLSSKISRAELITNYPGLPEIAGSDFSEAMKNQLKVAGISVTEGVATSVQAYGGGFALMCGADFYEAKTVIIATGSGASAELEGEGRLVGRGVSYCATCDGNLYRGKTLFVYCESAELNHEIEFLAGIAEKIYLYTKYPYANAAENIVMVAEKPISVEGENRIAGVNCGGRLYECDGAFFLKTSFAPSSLLAGLELAGSAVKVSRNMQTNIPGVFAAGDVTGAPFQYAKAAGEGNVAAHSVIKYLALNKG